MIVGRRFVVTPSDSLAVLAANAHLVPGYARGPDGHRALDADQPRRRPRRRARSASPATRRRPAGSSSATCSTPAWSTLCGEESAGTGSDHVREKDGLWAVLFWLNILARARRVGRADRARPLARASAATIYSRHDYEGVDADAANGLIARPARRARRRLPGRRSTRRRPRSRPRRRLRLHRPGRRLGDDAAGHPHRLRRRLAHRLSPVGHRHRRRDAAGLPRALRARSRRGRASRRRPRWRR